MVNLFYRWGSGPRASLKCLVQGQRILDLGALRHCLLQFHWAPFPFCRSRETRSRLPIHVRGPTGRPWHCWVRLLGIFNCVCFSVQEMGVKVLSTAEARFKRLSVTPPSCLLSLLGKFLAFFVKGVGALRALPRLHAPPSPSGPAGPPPAAPRGPRSVAVRRVGSGRKSSAICASSPLPPAPSEAICASLSLHLGAAFLPSLLSRSLRALSPLSGSFTAQSVIN